MLVIPFLKSQSHLFLWKALFCKYNVNLFVNLSLFMWPLKHMSCTPRPIALLRHWHDFPFPIFTGFQCGHVTLQEFSRQLALDAFSKQCEYMGVSTTQAQRKGGSKHISMCVLRGDVFLSKKGWAPSNCLWERPVWRVYCEGGCHFPAGTWHNSG